NSGSARQPRGDRRLGIEADRVGRSRRGVGDGVDRIVTQLVGGLIENGLRRRRAGRPRVAGGSLSAPSASRRTRTTRVATRPAAMLETPPPGRRPRAASARRFEVFPACSRVSPDLGLATRRGSVHRVVGGLGGPAEEVAAMLARGGSGVALPQGPVTFLFTDIEGSTLLLQERGDEYAQLLGRHRQALRDAFARHNGVEVDTQGDAFFVAFAKASDALAAAAAARDALRDKPVQVRMGLHTGEPTVTEDGYVGIDGHRAARIAAAGHGGQILLSQATRDLVGADRLRDLGVHRLKDLAAPERLYQLGDEEFPPLESLDLTNLPVQPTPFVGRERELAEVLALLDSHRVVTLTGPGGSGKTRLALQAAAEGGGPESDGGWLGSLAAVGTRKLTEPTIARVLGGPDALHESLAGKRTLLVLDNLEQLLPGAADVIAGLDARILATSRSRLNIAAEQELPVPTLPVDEGAIVFTQRARQLQPGFEPDAAVREIAERHAPP